MTPKHTTKRGRRYRYYVSQAVIQQRGPRDPTSQVPAHEVEQPAIQGLAQWLQSKADILDQVGRPTDDVAARKALLAGAEAWADLTERPPAQVRAFLLATLRQVTVEDTGLTLTLSREGLRTMLFRGRTLPTAILKPLSGTEEGDKIEVRVPTTVRRSGGVTRLIVPGESGGQAARPNQALINAVARAHVWGGAAADREGAIHASDRTAGGRN